MVSRNKKKLFSGVVVFVSSVRCRWEERSNNAPIWYKSRRYLTAQDSCSPSQESHIVLFGLFSLTRVPCLCEYNVTQGDPIEL